MEEVYVSVSKDRVTAVQKVSEALWNCSSQVERACVLKAAAALFGFDTCLGKSKDLEEMSAPPVREGKKGAGP